MPEKCPRCWIGDLHNFEAIYTRLVDEQHIFAMPQAPAWRCDICGFQAWDENFINMMEATFDDDNDDYTGDHTYPHDFADE